MTSEFEIPEPEVHGDSSPSKATSMPRPTYFPASMAFGITFLMWGIVTSPALLAAGGLIVVVSLVGWIGEMRHDP
ncbi:MAG: hypothetical protein ABSC94_03270 [Polyangiaceae bacterium]|jgi:hypothetical protein